jgi:hypothetical protein
MKICLIAAMAGCVAGACAANLPPPPSVPEFTWDRVPLYVHFGKRTADLGPGEVDFLVKNTRWVVLEKSHGASVHGSTERGIAASAMQIKKADPAMKVLFYLNAFIKWPNYDAYQTYQDEWTLLDPAGKVVTHPSGTPRFDPSNPDFREWWSEAIAWVHREAPLDGVFVDALPQALGPGLKRQVGGDKARAVIDGLREMIALAERKIGPERIIVANGLRTTDYREILDWPGIDYVIIEHFAGFETGSPEDIKADLESIPLALSKGKGVILKGWPGFDFTDREMMKRPHGELLERARKEITFPLACYLIGAQPGVYFCYSWGYTDTTGTLDSYPELERPLGPPRGDAVWSGNTATREFGHASVRVNLDTREAKIDWR